MKTKRKFADSNESENSEKILKYSYIKIYMRHDKIKHLFVDWFVFTFYNFRLICTWADCKLIAIRERFFFFFISFSKLNYEKYIGRCVRVCCIWIENIEFGWYVVGQWHNQIESRSNGTISVWEYVGVGVCFLCQLKKL